MKELQVPPPFPGFLHHMTMPLASSRWLATTSLNTQGDEHPDKGVERDPFTFDSGGVHL